VLAARASLFDADGDAQDSADEVNDPSWKVGDNCYAIYRPQSPGVASLQRGSERGQTEV